MDTLRSQNSEYRPEAGVGRVHDLPLQSQPREAVRRYGVENVPDEALLAVILRSGTKGLNVADLARGLLKEYGSLTGLARTSVEDLAGVHGMGPVKAQVLACALEIGHRIQEEKLGESPSITSPASVARLLGARAKSLEEEIFWVLLLDTKNRLKGQPQVVTRGILDASLVHPREVFREAVRTSTSSVILAHNHPSGDSAPSQEDLRVTRQLIDAGKLLDIRVLDHVIVGIESGDGSPGFTSLREAGLVEF